METILISISVFLFLLCIFLGVMLILASKKKNTYEMEMEKLANMASDKISTYEKEMERLANKSQEIITQYEKWILHYKSVVNEAYAVMQETDLRGSFEADDEVGNAFKAIKDVVDALQKFTNETITKTETIEQK